MFTVNSHALATQLKGFRSETLRVFVTRLEGNYAWVTTADLLDAGTKLVLDVAQLKAETPAEVFTHKSGLVSFEAPPVDAPSTINCKACGCVLVGPGVAESFVIPNPAYSKVPGSEFCPTCYDSFYIWGKDSEGYDEPISLTELGRQHITQTH